MSNWLRIAAAVIRCLVRKPSFCRGETSAQDIDFGKVDKFESLVSGTLPVDAPPKTFVDDGERHGVILTIWNADVPRRKSIGDRRDGNPCWKPFFRQFIVGRAHAFVCQSSIAEVAGGMLCARMPRQFPVSRR